MKRLTNFVWKFIFHSGRGGIRGPGPGPGGHGDPGGDEGGGGGGGCGSVCMIYTV